MQEHRLPTGERYVVSRPTKEVGGWEIFITWLTNAPSGLSATECRVPGLHETQEAAVTVAHEFAEAQVRGGPSLQEINDRFGVR